MDNPIYFKLLNDMKASHSSLLPGLIMLLITMFVIFFKLGRKGIIAFIIIALIIMGIAILDYTLVERRLKKMMKKMNFDSCDEFEKFLAGSQRLHNTLFISDKYLMDFELCRIVRLCNVKKIVPYNKGVESDKKYYGLKIITYKGKNDDLKLKDSSDRDLLLKVISNAVDFAKEQDSID